jgi:spore germination protein YaaH
VKHTTFFCCLPAVFSGLLFLSCQSAPPEPAEGREIVPAEDFIEETAPFIVLPEPDKTLPVSNFGEIWAYVMAGRESALSPGMPISDIGYFGAEIDSYGKLTDVPNPRRLRFFPARVHLVVTCNGRALSHFVLAHGSPERKALVADLIKAAEAFDGLQIDFELIPQRDGGTFLSFLAELRAGLGDKIFTAALPARTRKISRDVFDYENIKPLVDRILVMAYDEHWSSSEPGPIASLPWCKNVANYALRVIGRDKLVMGIPFYGRAWGHINPSRAYLHSGIETIISENGVSEIRRENGIPTFDYEAPVAVKVYYEDDYSLSARMELYKSLGVASIGFWRLGQETPAVWNILRLESAVDRE